MIQEIDNLEYDLADGVALTALYAMIKAGWPLGPQPPHSAGLPLARKARGPNLPLPLVGLRDAGPRGLGRRIEISEACPTRTRICLKHKG